MLEVDDLSLEAVSEAASLAFCVVEALRRHVCREPAKGFGRRRRKRGAVLADILKLRAVYYKPIVCYCTKVGS